VRGGADRQFISKRRPKFHFSGVKGRDVAARGGKGALKGSAASINNFDIRLGTRGGGLGGNSESAAYFCMMIGGRKPVGGTKKGGPPPPQGRCLVDFASKTPGSFSGPGAKLGPPGGQGADYFDYRGGGEPGADGDGGASTPRIGGAGLHSTGAGPGRGLTHFGQECFFSQTGHPNLA